MSDATKLADDLVERGITDAVPLDIRKGHPVERTEGYRIEMADGSALELVSNRFGSWETDTVTVARPTDTGVALDDPSAAYAWRIDERTDRPRLVEVEA